MQAGEKKRITGREFKNILINTPKVIEGIRFENCFFGENIKLSTYLENPLSTPVIRNCEFVGCTFLSTSNGGCAITDALLEDLLLQDCHIIGGYGGIVLKCIKMKHITIKGSFTTDQEISPYIGTRPLDIEGIKDSESYTYRTILKEADYSLYGFPETTRGAFCFKDILYASLEGLMATRNDYVQFMNDADWVMDISEAVMDHPDSHGLLSGYIAEISKKRKLTKI